MKNLLSTAGGLCAALAISLLAVPIPEAAAQGAEEAVSEPGEPIESPGRDPRYR